MEKIKIPLIALAVFSIFSLLSLNNLQSVFADETVVYDVDGNQKQPIGNIRIFAGEEITATSSLINVTINKISILLERAFTLPSEPRIVTIGIWDSTVEPTDSNYITLIATLDIDEISTDPTIHNFTFSSHTFSANEAIGVFFDHDADYMETWMRNADSFDSTNTRRTNYDAGTGWIDITTNDVDMLMLLVSGFTTIHCIEISEGGQQVCYSDPDGNGIPNFPQGSLNALNPPAQNVTTIGGLLVCAIGFNDDACTNTDPKTNGVGLVLLLLIALGSYSFLVSVHVGALKLLNKQNIQVMDYLKIEPYWLLLIGFIDVAVAFRLNWIEDIIFYTIIVLLAVFSALVVFNKIKGGGNG